MKNKEYLTIKELADILGVSRIAVYKKVKKSQIKAVRIGRNFAIPKKYVSNILGKTLNNKNKQSIDKAIKKTVKEYGDVLKLLGRE
ncbi:MAG: helix-turn-helix domain-containing protein [Candidatus Omnitrophica bacterium]|nr:helix-turn-helix domain-containing protein [Candidatus Omnitrophota bacterium]